jgi:AcrR family transcriptional regulator
VYHYFGSKEGVLLGVMERGEERYLAALPDFDRRIGSRPEHL